MAVKIDLRKKTVALSVGDLVAEPLINVGRVAGLSVWTRMELGREAHTNHQRAQAWSQRGYAREIAVKYATTVDEFKVTVQGRIDGVIAPGKDGEPWVIEEIKSVVVPSMVFAALNANSYPHYTEQLRLYCLFVEREKQSAAGRLVYVNVADGTRKEIEFAGPFADCEKLIADRLHLSLRFGKRLEHK